MSFTQEQIEALDALEAVFGPTDEKYLNNVKSRDGMGEYGYLHWIKRQLGDSLIHWMQYKYALDQNWDEIERIEREKREASRAERAEGIRNTIMTGFLAGLISKGSKAGEVMFDTTDEVVALKVLQGGRTIIFMAYNKGKRTLETQVAGEIFIEDVTLVHGNARPADQMKGYKAVVEFLDGQNIDTLP